MSKEIQHSINATVSGAAGHPGTEKSKKSQLSGIRQSMSAPMQIKVLERYVGTNRRHVKNCNCRPGDFRHVIVNTN